MKTVRVLKLYVILIIFLGISPSHTYSQLPELRNYNVNDGLPSSETYVILQHNDGYMYIGTDRGLARFDGNNFQTFTTADGLTDNTVFNLFMHKDALWYYSYSSDLGYLASNKFYDYRYNSVIYKHIMSVIWSCLIFNDDEILFNAPIDKHHVVFRITASGRLDSNLFEQKGALCAYVTPSNICFMAGNSYAPKLLLYDKPGGKLLAELSNNKTTKLAFARNVKEKTFFHANQSIYIIEKGLLTKISDCPANALYMFIDSKEDIWIGYKLKGVYHYKKSNSYRDPEHLLANFSISCITEDSEDGIWFTTLENGVYYLPPQRIYSYAKPGTTFTKTLNLHYINNVIYARQSDYSLVRLDIATQKWEKIFPSIPILSSRNGGDSVLFFTTMDNYKVKPKAGLEQLFDNRLVFVGKSIWATGPGIRYYNKKKLSGAFPKTPMITCGIELDSLKLLAGTLKGLFLYTNNQLLPVQDSIIGSSRISDLKFFDRKNILVCTQSKGLYILQLPAFKIVKHFTHKNSSKGIVYNTVYKDSNNTVWLGTNKGVCKISNILSSRLSQQWININNGLLSNEVYDIISVNGDTWAATARGISVMPGSTNLSYYHPIPVILQSITVNGKELQGQNSILRFDQNNITFRFSGLSYLYAGSLEYKYRLKKSGKEIWEYTDNPTINYNNLSPGKYRFEYVAIAPNQAGTIKYGVYRFTIDPPFWETWWFIFIVILFLISGLYYFFHLRIRFVKKQLKLKSDLAQYRDKALRDQMSPHFIYNSLNAIQNYIVKHDDEASVNFLSKFSRLMRLIFNNTGSDLVRIAKDLEALKLYIEMEKMRFPNKFEVIFAPIEDDLAHMFIPPLILQPFVENAILHGILPSDKPGHISIAIQHSANSIMVTIQDNGIGRKAAALIKAAKNKFTTNEETENKHHSATTVTAARIAQAWGENTNTHFSIVDLYDADGKASGTLVKFYLPYIYDRGNNN